MTLSQIDPARHSAPLPKIPTDAVHYIACTPDAACDARHGADFLAAVSRARQLVMAGARRIVFVLPKDAEDAALRRSLDLFARHVGRTMPSRRIEVVVMPLHGMRLPH